MMSFLGGHSLMINSAWSWLNKMAPMPPMMLILTSPDVIANLPVQIPMYSYVENRTPQTQDAS
jgi:hypothetical protein